MLILAQLKNKVRLRRKICWVFLLFRLTVDSQSFCFWSLLVNLLGIKCVNEFDLLSLTPVKGGWIDTCVLFHPLGWLKLILLSLCVCVCLFWLQSDNLCINT